VHGATGARVPNLVAKASWQGGDSATVLRHPMVAASAWGRQIKHCLVTKENVQVSRRTNSRCIRSRFAHGEALSRAKRTQHSSMGKKIWFSMHPRNLRSDKIARKYVRPLILANVKCLTSLKVQGIYRRCLI